MLAKRCNFFHKFGSFLIFTECVCVTDETPMRKVMFFFASTHLVSQLSLFSNVPRHVCFHAYLKMCSQKLSALPCGKTLVKSWRRWLRDSFPFGHSDLKWWDLGLFVGSRESPERSKPE